MIAFYNNISHIEGGNDSYQNRIVSIPDNANIFYFSCLFTELNDFNIAFKEKVPFNFYNYNDATLSSKIKLGESYEIKKINSLFKENNAYFNLIDDKEITFNYFYTPDGSRASNEQWAYIKIPVIENEFYSLYGSRTITSFFEYDLSHNISGGIDSYNDCNVQVPKDAHFMVISFLKENIEKLVVSKTDDSEKIINMNDLLVNPSKYFNVYNKEEINKLISEKNPVIMEVNSSMNLRTILESIKDASKTNPYIILLREGTYDIKSYYSEEEISDPNFKGLFVPEWCKLFGVGNRDNIILTYTNEDETRNSKISTVNLYLNSELQNLTVYGRHIRYACHDDWTPSNYTYEKYPTFTKTIKNCKFIGDQTYIGTSYGSGFKSGCSWLFENCIFETQNDNSAALYMHNNNGFEQAANILFKNCRFKTSDMATHSIILSSLNLHSDVINDILFIGCSANKKIKLSEDNAELYGQGIKMRLSGYANNFSNSNIEIANTDEQDYSSYIDLL